MILLYGVTIHWPNDLFWYRENLHWIPFQYLLQLSLVRLRMSGRRYVSVSRKQPVTLFFFLNKDPVNLVGLHLSLPKIVALKINQRVRCGSLAAKILAKHMPFLILVVLLPT